MLKILKGGAIGTLLLFGLTGCQSELSNEELKGLKACYDKPTGISLWSNNILQVKKKIQRTGADVAVLKDGGELTIDMGGAYIILDEIDYKDGTCFEIRSIDGDKGQLTKDSGDDFLLLTALFFGHLSSTAKDKEIYAKEKIEREQEKENKINQLNQELESAKVAEQKFTKFLKEFNEFADTNKLNQMGSSSELILSDKVINDLKVLIIYNNKYSPTIFDSFLKEINNIAKIPESDRKYPRAEISSFSMKYTEFKRDLKNKVGSELSYNIMLINDKIFDLNHR